MNANPRAILVSENATNKVRQPIRPENYNACDIVCTLWVQQKYQGDLEQKWQCSMPTLGIVHSQ